MGTMDLMLNEVQSRFGISGGSASALLSSFLSYATEQGSGLRGLFDRFKATGAGEAVSSWLSGATKPISAENVENALGTNTVNNLASRAGLSAGTAASALAFMVPTILQRMAPGGHISSQLPADLSSYVSGTASAGAARVRDAAYSVERPVASASRNYLWPIIGLLLLLLAALWLWNRAASHTATFNADQQVRLATEKAESALAALKPGFTAQDLTSALNLSVINFASNSADIPQDNYDLLNKAAAAIKAAPAQTVIEIAGHTDNSGDQASNLQLSQRRADAVRSYLVSQGVDPTMLTAKGYGDSRPVASNDTEEGKFRNRRIEFNVIH